MTARSRRDEVNGGVVRRVEAGDQTGSGLPAAIDAEPGERVGERVRAELRRAAAALGQLGQPDPGHGLQGRDVGHGAMIGPPREVASITLGVGLGRCPARSQNRWRGARRRAVGSLHMCSRQNCGGGHDVRRTSAGPRRPARGGAGLRLGRVLRHTLGREPRPLFLKGVTALRAADIAPGQAIEIGFGDGTETLTLLGAGWRVLAIDPAPAATTTLQAQVMPAVADRLKIGPNRPRARRCPRSTCSTPGTRCHSSIRRIDQLGRRARPPASGRAPRRELLRPARLLVRREGMSFLELDAVRRLFEGLDVLALDEEDQDGDFFLVQHWHVFDVIARRRGAATE